MSNFPSSISTDANLFIAKNNLSTALNGAINSAVTTITVVSTTGFPTAGYITIEAEAIQYTGTTGTTFTGCTRGADGTSAASHADTLTVYHDIVAAHHNVLKDEVKAIETSLTVIKNVKDYGAVGDGSTDDTVAIQAALTAVGAGRLYFPPANYKITASLQLILGSQLLGSYQNGSFGGTTITQTSAVPIFKLVNSNSTGYEEQDILLTGFCLSGGTNAIRGQNGAVNFQMQNVLCTGQSAECVFLRGFVQQCKFRDVELSGGTYGLYWSGTGLKTDNVTLGTPELLDKNSFYTTFVHGQSINGLYLVNAAGVAIDNVFVDLIFNNINQDGAVFGGLQTTTVINCNIEAVGYTGSAATTPTTATTTAGSATVTVASGTGIANGNTLAIGGAGTNGIDWYPVVSSGGGTTTLVMTTTAPRAVTAQRCTNHLYSGLKLLPTCSNTTFLNCILAGEATSIAGLRYAIDAAGSTSSLAFIGGTTDCPIYDPNFTVSVSGSDSLALRLQRPPISTLDPYSTPSFGGTGGVRSLVPSSKGSDVTIALLDSAGNGTGTLGHFDVRTRNSHARLFDVDGSNGNQTLDTGSLSFGTSGKGITGTTTNDSANAGIVGEEIRASATTVSTGTGNYFDITHVDLTAGCWSVSVAVDNIAGTGVMTAHIIGISSTTGNSSTGLTFGDNAITLPVAPANGSMGGGIASYRVSLASPTTYYLKCNLAWSSGTTPSGRGRISAIRTR